MATAPETDSLEYIYCDIQFGTEIDYERDKPTYCYISEIEDIAYEDVVVVPSPRGERLGVVTSVKRYLGKDAPWQVSETKHILRYARGREIEVGRALGNDSDYWDFEAVPMAEPGTESYSVQKKRLLDLISNIKLNHRRSEGLNLSLFIPEFAESSDMMSQATYIKPEKLAVLRTRVRAGNSASRLVRRAKIGRELSCRTEPCLIIVDPYGDDIGRLKPEVEEAILPLLQSENAVIEKIAVGLSDPLYVDIYLRLK